VVTRVAIEFPTEKEVLRFERYLKSGSGRAFAKRHFSGRQDRHWPELRRPGGDAGGRLAGRPAKDNRAAIVGERVKVRDSEPVSARWSGLGLSGQEKEGDAGGRCGKPRSGFPTPSWARLRVHRAGSVHGRCGARGAV